MSPPFTSSPSSECRKLWNGDKTPGLMQLAELAQGMLSHQLCEVLLLDQALRWERQEGVPVEKYFELFPEFPKDRESAIDLVYSEFLLREHLGLEPNIEEYVVRFPLYKDELEHQDSFHRVVGTDVSRGPIERPNLTIIDNQLRAPGLSSEVDPEDLEKPLPQIPGYQMVCELGRGGHGVVYKARHLKLNRFVAIKMLLAGNVASPSLLRRFLVEAEATARLQHPNIVQIYEVGQWKGSPFLALEFVNGGTLSQWANGRPLAPREAASITLTLANALEFAHGQGVVHRDLKPGNVLIQRWPQANASDLDPDSTRSQNTSDGMKSRESVENFPRQGYQYKIADFGLAKLLTEPLDGESAYATSYGAIIGTAAYMSPEQARGDSQTLTPATDVYSLGAILYELLTGRPPYVGAKHMDVLVQLIHFEPIRPSQLVRRLPHDIQTICLKCLEKNPGRRYVSAEALADDLNRFLDDRPIVARRISSIERAARWIRRNPGTTSILASIASVVISMLLFSSLYSIQLGRQLQRTRIAESSERRAKVEAWNQLWESKLSQADAIRTSHRVGQRYDALHAIDGARTLADSIRFTDDQIRAMQTTTIACLALSDMREDPSWKKHVLPSAEVLAVDGIHHLVASIDSNCVRVACVSTGEEVVRIPTTLSTLKAMFSRDRKRLAIVGDECRVYDLEGKEGRLLFASKSRGAWGFTQDGSKIIGTDGDGELALIELDQDLEVKQFGPMLTKGEIVVSPDSRLAATYDGESIRVVELETGRTILQIHRPYLSSKKLFAWHPNSRILAVGSQSLRGIELWNVDEGMIWKSIADYAAELEFCFSSTGERLLAHNVWNQTIAVWNVNINAIEFTKNFRSILSAVANDEGGFRVLVWQDDNQVACWMVDVPGVYHTLPVPSSGESVTICDLDFSEDGSMLAVASAFGELMVLDTKRRVPIARWASGSCLLRFDRNQSLFTANELGLARWKIIPKVNAENEKETGRFQLGPPAYLNDSIPYASMDISKDGKLVAIPTPQRIVLHSLDGHRQMPSIGPTKDVRKLSFSPDGRRIATSEWNSGRVCIWEIESGKCVQILQESPFCHIAFSPNGRWLATNSDRVHIWDTATWERTTELSADGTSVSGVCIAFSPDSKAIAVSDLAGRINFFDPSDGRKLYSLTDPSAQHFILLAFNPNGSQLAAFSYSLSVQLWDLKAIHHQLRMRRLDCVADSKNMGLGDDDELDNNPLWDTTIDAPSASPLDLHVQLDQRFLEIEAAQRLSLLKQAIEKSDFDAARIASSRIIKLHPKRSTTCNDFAWTLATGPKSLRDPGVAVEFAQRALEDTHISPSQRAVYMNSLGVALYRNNRYNDAAKVLEQSLAEQREQDRPFDLYFLSMCSSAIGERDKAQHYFDQAESLAQKFRPRMTQAWIRETEQFADEAKASLR